MLPPSNAINYAVHVTAVKTVLDDIYWIESETTRFGIGLPPMEYTPKVGDVYVFYWDPKAKPGTNPLGFTINDGPYIQWPNKQAVLKFLREKRGWSE